MQFSILVESDQKHDKYETIMIESKIREGFFTKSSKIWKVEKLFLVLVNVGAKETSHV
jgi:hypothetical protein